MAPLWQGLDSHSSISFSQLIPDGGWENEYVTGESKGEMYKGNDEDDASTLLFTLKSNNKLHLSTQELQSVYPGLKITLMIKAFLDSL